MHTSDFELEKHVNLEERAQARFDRAVNKNESYLSQDLMDNMTSSPLGHLLKMISTLPEVRQEKVNLAKSRLSGHEYDLGDGLDLALDKVLEEFIAD